MKVLITGVAGFIGFSLAKKFLENGCSIYGLDNYDSYYSVKLKKMRINELKKFKKFKFYNLDISNFEKLDKQIKKINFHYVYHFAAQPGVRYSLINPKKYITVNIFGFQNLLRVLEKKKIKAIIYASSSSVYGDQKKFPVSEKNTLKAKNPYGLSKIMNEEMAEIYSKILKIPIIGLRLFTVYGEWGRPDMYIIKLLNSIYKKKVFELNNAGNHYRDFTHISDVVSVCLNFSIYKNKNKHEIFNVCSGKTINLNLLTNKIKKIYPQAKIKNISANNADVYKTYGNKSFLLSRYKIKKFKDIKYGLKKTVEWFEEKKISKFL